MYEDEVTNDQTSAAFEAVVENVDEMDVLEGAEIIVGMLDYGE